MADFTNEQKEAIYKSGTNIIVSAGAGSGKTAVLSERVLQKVMNGNHINELLILTFTSAAASEMKDRIRSKIKNIDSLKDELNLINSSYITTFDSFALSVVKKYHYLINVSSDISISDESLVLLEEKKIIDNIFEELYSKKDLVFLNMINNYCYKNDKTLRQSVLKLAKNINNKINKEELFDYIENNYFNDDNIDKIIDEYRKFIEGKKKIIRYEISNLSYYFDSDYVSKILESTSDLLNSDIDALPLFSKVSLPRVPNNTSDEAKEKKKNVKDLLDELVGLGEYGDKFRIKESILNNKSIVFEIINIVKEFINRLDNYKRNNSIYTFSDIAYSAINILKNNKSARDELKYAFKEIMIDEYQDTNDVQDIFISLIENNNVYMVGDIKQSIYKFRGSNPNIFKEKYDEYSKGNAGYKIDLIKNFRSRNEVLNNINDIFGLIMDYDLGGANYKESHEMIYGNKKYDTLYDDINYNVDIIEYDTEIFDKFSNIEKEIFIIANDIKNKYSNKIKVFDKNTSSMRNIKYSDFVIILDRSKYFDLFKKIFEYEGIPLNILKDEKLNSSDDILLIKNIIDFILRINNKDYGEIFKYDFMSIGRSFLYEYNDSYLFDLFKNNNFNNSELFRNFNNININSITSSELFELILDKTDFYNKIYKVGDYENVNVRIKTLHSMFSSLNELGLGIEEIRDYLENVNEEDISIKYNAYNSSSDSVKILTIHKSKGLEYPICYFADLDHKFNMKDADDLFVVSNKYGLIVPNTMDDSDNSILKKLYKYDYVRDEIDEKIRLLYVALTRAREKMIIVLPYKETIKLEKNENGVIDEIRRLSFNKLSDFIYGIKDYNLDYFKSCNLEDINLTKDYLYNKSSNNKLLNSNENFVVNEIKVNNDELNDEHFSKEDIKLLDKDEIKLLDFGTKVHETLELIDFYNYNEELIDNEYVREKISKFLKSDILKDIKNCNVYKEYEFIYYEDNTKYHGVIDLMIEHEEYIDIIDYKLKNIEDEKYIKQLNGYKKYITSVSDKKVNLYLYSIIDETIQKI